MSNIIGHRKNLETLSKIINDRSIHNSFIFWGPESIGKFTIAKTFADNLACSTSKWTISNNINGDVFVVEPERVEKKKKIVIRDISIDAIKEANKWAATAPIGDAKVLIINDAHRMTTSAQNALLKNLEEPREKRFIILVTNSSDALLATIKSRCFDLQFDIVGDAELTSKYENNEFLKDINGRPGFLSRIDNDEEFKEIVEFARESLQGFFQTSISERMKLADELSKKDDEYLNIFFQIWIYRIWAAAHKTKKFNLLKLSDKVEDVMNKMQNTNVNKKLILEDLFINM
ncbi:MAG: AAA family ATPase [Candidatus Moraniibacteriota bacterium]|jgi:replication-associated recombination protein RarA